MASLLAFLATIAACSAATAAGVWYLRRRITRPQPAPAVPPSPHPARPAVANDDDPVIGAIRELVDETEAGCRR